MWFLLLPDSYWHSHRVFCQILAIQSWHKRRHIKLLGQYFATRWLPELSYRYARTRIRLRQCNQLVPHMVLNGLYLPTDKPDGHAFFQPSFGVCQSGRAWNSCFLLPRKLRGSCVAGCGDGDSWAVARPLLFGIGNNPWRYWPCWWDSVQLRNVYQSMVHTYSECFRLHVLIFLLPRCGCVYLRPYLI